MDIKKLTAEARALKEVKYDSPKVDVWVTRVTKLILSEFGQEYSDIFTNIFSSNYVLDIYESHESIQRKFGYTIDKAIDFLASFEDIPPIKKVPENSRQLPDISFLDSEIYKPCKSLYYNQSYTEAVEKSFKIVRNRLRNLTGWERGSEAFGKGKLHIKGAAAPHVDKNFNSGVRFLTMAIDRFRNEKSHAVTDITDPALAHAYLSLSSLAMSHLQNAEIINSTKE